MSTAPAQRPDLVRHSTAAAPKIGFEEAVRTVEDFHTRHAGLKPAQIPQAMADDPHFQEAVVAYLKYRFTPLADTVPRQSGSMMKVEAISLAALSALDATRQKAVLEEVVFNVAFPPSFEALAPQLRRMFSAPQLERAILDRLGSENPLHQRNALELPYYLFRWQPGYDVSPQGSTALKARADALKADSATHPAVKDTLSRARLP